MPNELTEAKEIPASAEATAKPTKAKLVIEGQTREVDYALVTDGATVEEQDRNLIQYLRPNFDLIDNATIARSTKDGELTVTVLKAPGKKGGRNGSYQRILQRLLEAPPAITPIIEVDCSMRILAAQGKLDLEALIKLRPLLAETVAGGRQTLQRMEHAKSVLLSAPAVAGTSRPIGF